MDHISPFWPLCQDDPPTFRKNNDSKGSAKLRVVQQRQQRQYLENHFIVNPFGNVGVDNGQGHGHGQGQGHGNGHSNGRRFFRNQPQHQHNNDHNITTNINSHATTITTTTTTTTTVVMNDEMKSSHPSSSSSSSDIKEKEIRSDRNGHDGSNGDENDDNDSDNSSLSIDFQPFVSSSSSFERKNKKKKRQVNNGNGNNKEETSNDKNKNEGTNILIPKSKVCMYFQNGNCHFGYQCRNRHVNVHLKNPPQRNNQFIDMRNIHLFQPYLTCILCQEVIPWSDVLQKKRKKKKEKSTTTNTNDNNDDNDHKNDSDMDMTHYECCPESQWRIKEFEKGKNVECSICLEKAFTQNSKCCLLSHCVHVFHSDCIKQWKHVKQNQLICPLCRTPSHHLIPCRRYIYDEQRKKNYFEQLLQVWSVRRCRNWERSQECPFGYRCRFGHYDRSGQLIPKTDKHRHTIPLRTQLRQHGLFLEEDIFIFYDDDHDDYDYNHDRDHANEEEDEEENLHFEMSMLLFSFLENNDIETD